MNRLKDRVRRNLAFVVTAIGLVAGSYLVASFVVPGRSEAVAQDRSAADLYGSQCAACHQPGGEGIVGTFPPLAGNPAAADAAYVDSVIREGLSGPIEVLGESYDSDMPAVGSLSDTERELLVSFVVELAGGSSEPSEPDTPVEPPAVGSADRGHDLFAGSDRFDNGAAACVACHTAGDVGNLGGRSLGPDLDDVYDRFGGEAGLTAWLSNPPSETMAPIFEDRALADTEIADLVAFLADAPNRDEPGDQVDWLTLAGVAGLVVLLGGMAVAWRGMRQTYVEVIRSRK